jgi:hypothetical protein
MIGLRKSATLLGMATGLSLWIYDYDFFLNAGGPAAPVSTAILRLSRLGDADYPAVVFWPLCVLIGAGAIAGLAVAKIIRHGRPRHEIEPAGPNPDQ